MAEQELSWFDGTVVRVARPSRAVIVVGSDREVEVEVEGRSGECTFRFVRGLQYGVDEPRVGDMVRVSITGSTDGQA